jgi:hypothetical protein
MDGGTISASAVSSIFTATLRISQVIYELKAVGEQTRDLLDSTTHVETSLEAVRTLRRQKSRHLDATEKRWIDDVLINTEKTLGNVATLIEPARVDMQTKFGRVGFVNRGLFVFRDSPKVGTNLSRLNLASQSLNTAMNVLCMREGRTAISPTGQNALHMSDPTNYMRNDAKPPPTYIESEFLKRRRHTHTSRTTVSRCSSSVSLGTVEEKPDLPAPVVNMTEEETKAAETMDRFTLEDNVMVAPPVVAVQEVNLTPVEPSQKNPFDEADGLQLCEATYFQSPISQNVDIADGLQVCDAEYITSAHILNFEGADGLEVCDGKHSSSPYTQESQFHGADGLQVCSAWNSPIPLPQDSAVDGLQIQLGQRQQRQSNQWHEQPSSYQQLPYPLSQDERSSAGYWHSPWLQTHQWHSQHAVDQHRPISRSPNPPYPNSPSPNQPYQNKTTQNSPYQDPPYPNPPYPIRTQQHQPAYQQSPYQQHQNQEPQWQHPPPSLYRPLPSSDDKLRTTLISTYATSDRPLSQDMCATSARPVSKPLNAHQLTESPSSTFPSDVSRHASQSSTSSWTPSEVSQTPPMSTRKSRGRAWLEFQSER